PFPDERALAEALADHRQTQLCAKPSPTPMLPTGRTPLPLYRALVERPRRGLSFAHLRTFNLEGLRGLSGDHPSSFRAYMERNLFSLVDLPPTNIHFLQGDAQDPKAECERYEVAISTAGGIDLAILGLGANGHVAFNEPGDALHPR